MRLNVKNAIVSTIVVAATLAASLAAATPAFASGELISMTGPTGGHVANGATGITVTLQLNSTTGIAAAGTQIQWDHTKLACDTAVYASPSYFGSSIYNNTDNPAQGLYIIDNTAGTCNLASADLQANGHTGGPTLWVTLTFHALGTNTTTSIQESNDPTVTNFTDTAANTLNVDSYPSVNLTIGAPPQPNLFVPSNSVSTTGVTDATDTHFNVSFTVKNDNSPNLTADAAGFDITVAATNATPATQTIHCDGLTAGNTQTFTTAAAFNCTGSNSIVTINADSGNVIIEGNENDNTAQGSYSPAPAGQTNVVTGGGPVSYASFVQPANVNFGTNMVRGLNANDSTLGLNNVATTLTVVTNQGWTIAAQGMAPTTASGYDGKMTKWNGNWVAAVKLHNALTLIATGGLTGPGLSPEPSVPDPTNYKVSLTGGAQNLASGITDGQNPDGVTGESRTVTFNQIVMGNDPVLQPGYSYNMVVLFTMTTEAY